MKAKNIKQMEKKLWSTEEELNQCTSEKEQNKKKHIDLANKNEQLNNNIDDSLL